MKMRMKEVAKSEPLTDAIGKMGKSFLHISAHIDHGGMGMMDDDISWRKKELKRLREEVKATEKEIKDWDPVSVADKALKSLKADLAMKKARVMETEAILDINEKEDEEEEE